MPTDSKVELETTMQSPETAAGSECLVGELEAEQRQPLLAATHEWLHRLQELQEAPPQWQVIDGPTGDNPDKWTVEEVRTWFDLAFETTDLLHTHITTVADSLDIAATCDPNSREHDDYVLEAANTFTGDVHTAIGGFIRVDEIGRILDEYMVDSVLEDVEFASPDMREMIESALKNGNNLDHVLQNIIPLMPEIITAAIQRLKETYSRQGRMTEYYEALQPLKTAMKLAGVNMTKPRSGTGIDRASQGVSLDFKKEQNMQNIAVHRELAKRIEAQDVIELFDRLALYQADYDSLITYLNDKHDKDATRVRRLATKQSRVFDEVTTTVARLREVIVAKIHTNGEAAIAESFANLPEAVKGFVDRCLARGTQTPTTPEIDATAAEIVDGGQRIQDFLDAKAIIESFFVSLEMRGAKFTSAAMRDRLEHVARVEKTIFTLIGAVASRWDHVINSEQVRAALSLEQRKASTEKFNDLLQGVFPGIRYATDQLQD